MGDLQVWPQPNGVLTEENPSLANPHPSVIGVDRWLRAEKRTSEIICRIQPTVVSEQRRKSVVDYVQGLIRGYLGSEVFPFGSVPLKTYLPDGDIDLTALSNFPNVEDALANDVRSVLEGEEQNKAAEFEVKDVQYIHAEVKLVKCLVQNIVVDISFNQLGGLCTLCFLEQVDRLIGKDHLFKCSIILIKAWCYYESRILGAHHGLISTYALETLVLYIFHLFHSSLHGPLEVLYRFLDHFSKFDWDNYCVSLNGPVCVSSLPEIVAETPENDGGDLLLSKEFLKNCVDMFSVPSKVSENNSRAFPMKHLNIVDPLKENNNLGRSVSKGNFYRIRSAFSYGARKLGRILLLSEECITDELNKFFMNTLDRHGSGQRPDVQDPVSTSLSPPFGLNWSGSLSSKSDPKKSTEEKTVAETPSVDSNGAVSESTVNIHGVSCEEINSIKISEPENKDGTEIKLGQVFNHQPRASDLRRCAKVGTSSAILECNMSMDGSVFSGSRLDGDATDLASSRISGPRVMTELIKPPSVISDQFVPSFGRAPHAPHLYFLENGNVDRPNFKNSIIQENKVVSQSRSSEGLPGLVLPPDSNDSGFSSSNHERSSTLISTDGFLVLGTGLYPSEDLYLNNQPLAANDSLNYCESSSAKIVSFGDMDLASSSSSHEASDTLSELTGDYDSYLRSLFYAQCCHELILYGPVLPYPPPPRSYLHKNHSWDGLRGPPQLKRNVFPHMNANGVVPTPPFPPVSGYYAVKPPIISSGFSVEELPKPRGTGTYFPNLNHRSYKERHSPGRGRSAAVVSHNQLQRPRNNGRAMAAPENLPEKVGHDLSLSQFPVFNGNGRGKPGSLDFVPPVRPTTYPSSNGLPSERVEFGSLGPVTLGPLSPEQGRRPDSGAIYAPASVPVLSIPPMQRPGLVLNQERVSQSYHLKDEDFPPLSV